MKKLKEILLLLSSFVIFFLSSFLIYLPSPLVPVSETAFFGASYYLNLFFNDKTFWIAIINTFKRPFICSVVLIALLMLILKKQIKFTRKSYYFTIFAVSLIISALIFFSKAVLYNVLGYIFFPILIGILCVICFWILELIVDIFNMLRKGKTDE